MKIFRRTKKLSLSTADKEYGNEGKTKLRQHEITLVDSHLNFDNNEKFENVISPLPYALN